MNKSLGVWVLLLIAVGGLAFVLGRISSAPEHTRLTNAIGLPASTETQIYDGLGNTPQVSNSTQRPRTERVAIRPGQTWTSADLLAINDVSQELFAGNAERWESQTGHRYSKEFVFPDGTHLVVDFDTNPDSETWAGLDDGVSPGFFEPLSQAAEQGNGAAARHLYASLKDCAHAPSSATEYNAMVSELRRDTTIYANREEHVHELQIRYHRCIGTTNTMLDTALELMRRSGEAGNPHSALIWAFEAYDAAQPSIVESTLVRLWEEYGFVAALSALGQIHTERSPSTYQAAVTAYAYNYASLVLALAEVDGIAEGEFIREQLINEMKWLENAESYSIAQDGMTLAHLLISENRNCCK